MVCLAVWGMGCGSNVSDLGDVDHDTISNRDEGLREDVDTDRDDLPDYRDFDSDGDGVLDAIEAGDTDLASVPVDTDADGYPDFRDQDCDGDGVKDTEELSLLFEVVDTDGDGLPDLRDQDSDGDTIGDDAEGVGLFDFNGNGVPDFRDSESDGDGISDACEAGDSIVGTSPRDTDRDRIPDFRDLDSDGDGISDREEDKNGNCIVDAGESSALAADTDGDLVPDLVETLAGSDVNDPNSTIPPTDFYFVLPYRGEHASGNLDFSTSVRTADIFFSIDNTGSFDGETSNIQSTLQSVIIPGVSAVVTNPAFGVGRFADFPLDPYGLAGDRPYELRQAISTDLDVVSAAIAGLSAPVGGLDVSESGYEALYQWATGVGFSSFGLPPFQSNPPNGIGGAGFRKDSLPIVVHITDATAHEPDDYVGFGASAHGRNAVVDAMKQIGARIIAINSLENEGTSFDPRAQLEDLAVNTKGVIPPNAEGSCNTGVGGAAHAPVTLMGVDVCPLVFDVRTDGTGLGTLIVDAIRQLAQLGVLDISTRTSGKRVGERDESVPSGNTTADFIKGIVPIPPAPDGAAIVGNEFHGVTPGSTVTFGLDAYNDFIPPTAQDQLFTTQIQILGDAVTVLDTRTVFVIVPKQLNQLIVF